MRRIRSAAVLSVVLLLTVGIVAVAQTGQTDRQALQQICGILVNQGVATGCVTTSTTTSTTLPPTTSSTTSTTVPPTTSTSTTQPPTTTSTTAPAGGYGTSGTGPGLEPCTTVGIAVTTSAAVTSAPQNSVILMRAGTYSTGFTVPQGSTVKPYNCEVVQINDNINVNNNSIVAGLRITANADGWAIRITARTNVEIRNSIIKGGSTEAIRVDGASNNVRLLANHVDGGDNNHTIKVTSNSGGGTPTNVTLRNNLLTKIHFGGGEDLLQLEGHGVVTVDHNTFRDNPTGEDGFDIKNGGGVTITGNDFQGATINIECLLVNGAPPQPILVESNRFNGCTAMLGANNSGSPTWNFRTNLLVGSLLHLRRSSGAQIIGNTWQGGGSVRLGTSTSGDVPTNATFSGNNFGTATWSVSGGTFTCDGTNSGTGSAGSACN